MKIYINSAKENWIVDRLKHEWKTFNSNTVTRSIYRADIVWLIAPWTWKNININTLNKKKVVCSIYHIDEDKFDTDALKEFNSRDVYVDYYHTISLNSRLQLKKLTSKPIFVSPFWINQNIFYEISEKIKLRDNLGIAINDYLIGSFQRDTEGFDMVSPKLSKGPDRFIEIVEHYQKQNSNLAVLLTGKRRNYIINELKKREIKYYYFEMVDYEVLNQLYNCLDLYIVSSRYEGGPQAILECAVTNTPIISTDVGVAKEILPKESIYSMENFKNAKPNTSVASVNISKYLLPRGMDNFLDYFKDIYEN